MKRNTAICGVFVAAALLSLPLFEPAIAVGAAPRVKNHCAKGEAVIYSCSFGAKTASVCLGADKVTYHYGRPKAVELSIVSKPDWSNVHLGYVTGGGGGHQATVRFTKDGHDYVVYKGVAGSLHENPGHRWSGLDVAYDGEIIDSKKCTGKSIIASDFWAIGEKAPADVRDSLQEPAGSMFDGWY